MSADGKCAIPGCHRKARRDHRLCKYHYRMAEVLWLAHHTGEGTDAT